MTEAETETGNFQNHKSINPDSRRIEDVASEARAALKDFLIQAKSKKEKIDRHMSPDQQCEHAIQNLEYASQLANSSAVKKYFEMKGLKGITIAHADIHWDRGQSANSVATVVIRDDSKEPSKFIYGESFGNVTKLDAAGVLRRMKDSVLCSGTLLDQVDKKLLMKINHMNKMDIVKGIYKEIK